VHRLPHERRVSFRGVTDEGATDGHDTGANDRPFARVELTRTMLELDLIGRKISLSDGDARLLLAAAEAASGSSIGSRDLATRLKEIADPSSNRRRKLVFSRPETRALQRVVQTRFGAGDQLRDLQLALHDLLAIDDIGHTPARPSSTVAETVEPAA